MSLFEPEGARIDAARGCAVKHLFGAGYDSIDIARLLHVHESDVMRLRIQADPRPAPAEWAADIERGWYDPD